jgi:hypothetical protein
LNPGAVEIEYTPHSDHEVLQAQPNSPSPQPQFSSLAQPSLSSTSSSLSSDAEHQETDTKKKTHIPVPIIKFTSKKTGGSQSIDAQFASVSITNPKLPKFMSKSKPPASPPSSPPSNKIDVLSQSSPAVPKTAPKTVKDNSTDFQLFLLENYADRFFDPKRAKKKMFGLEKAENSENISIPNVHSTEVIPLLKYQSKDEFKEAEELSKMVLVYMGDRPHKGSEDRVSIFYSIISRAILSPLLRDEIYCIICKQTNRNPHIGSLLLGWEMLAVITNAFGPSKDLFDNISSYFERVRNNEL